MKICPRCAYIDTENPSSNQQRRAYFGLGVKMLADHLGYDKEDMHKTLAGEFFGYTKVKLNGKIHLVPKSTKGRTTKEFMEYFEFIQRIGAQNGIIIPSPNEPPLVDA